VRFLGVGETNDLGDMYLRLKAKGHEVRVSVSDEASRDVMQGMLDFTADWRGDLSWLREAGDDGIVLFETACDGDTQDELRRDGFHVIGGSALGDRLEGDREYGQEMLRQAGLVTAATHAFDSFDDAIAFLRTSPDRYVFKLSGSNWPSTRGYVGQMDDGADMIALLSTMRARWMDALAPRFVLMEHVTGIEVGVGAFFDGERFLSPPNLDWEHKRFFPGDVGELTGEMGTVVTYRGARRMFDATLSRFTGMLKDSGYCGYINLNTIVNERGIWPLEFTCRFGYPGFPILDSLHLEGWDAIFQRMVHRHGTEIPTADGYSVGVVITVPPFPYSEGYDDLGKGVPISFREPLSDAERNSFHYGEVSCHAKQLTTAGMIGYIMVVTGIDGTIEGARRNAYNVVNKVVIPNARYRNDIGIRLIDRDYAELDRLGWIG